VWLSGWDAERARSGTVLTGAWTPLADAMDEHGAALRASAARLTRDGVVVHHGDLHGRNLILGHDRRCTVIDWDEAGFSRRPADAAKALWMSCRRERGDFALDPAAVRAFLRHTRFPAADAVDLGRLGALWFLPRSRHVTLLARRDATFPEWYLGWVSRFWARLRPNLDLIAETAALTL
jgi:Ser/Thr protein kinase RdoA (MazF antagonist)